MAGTNPAVSSCVRACSNYLFSTSRNLGIWVPCIPRSYSTLGVVLVTITLCDVTRRSSDQVPSHWQRRHARSAHGSTSDVSVALTTALTE